MKRLKTSLDAFTELFKPEPVKYQLITYDVWGNDTDGYKVNNAFTTSDYITLTGDETDDQILQIMIDAGISSTDAIGKIEFTGEHEYSLYAEWVSNGKPAFELRSVSL